MVRSIAALVLGAGRFARPNDTSMPHPMTHSSNDFLQIARQRGYIHQVTDETALSARLSQGPLPAYVGFDCTADSLHVGHLVSIMLLRLLQRCGHKPVPLIGGGTTKIGDPSGRDEGRQLLTEA